MREAYDTVKQRELKEKTDKDQKAEAKAYVGGNLMGKAGQIRS